MKLKTFLAILFISCFGKVYAYSDYIIASGKNIGIELNANGVMVVGFYKVNDDYIAANSGLEVGDVITTINDESVSSINDLTEKIDSSLGEIKIGYVRNNISKYTNLKLYKDESKNYKTGIFVKDKVSGIGTLTYIDPSTNVFGALGHEIVDSNTGKILNTIKGNIFNSTVTKIVPSTNGTPGEKNATVFSNEVMGLVKENTIKGIFGNYIDDINNEKLYKVAKYEEIKTSSAKILTVLNGITVNEYDIDIKKINPNEETKNILFEITDSDLLENTNGIIQGMSGSPIVQDNYIIGAVTHVVVDNPHKGYGILITKMLEEGEN